MLQRAPQPTIPTSASVARAATESNQISLRQVSLIGVYGQPGSRRALVRLANGRYQKVQVGDRLDGGQVAAIGSEELQYVKRGRAVTLTMPRGIVMWKEISRGHHTRTEKIQKPPVSKARKNT